MSIEIILQILREKIEFLEKVPPNDVDLELAKIMEYIKSQPRLLKVYSSILREEEEFYRPLFEASKSLLIQICQLIIKLEPEFSYFRGLNEDHPLVEEIRRRIHPKLKEFKMDELLIGQVRNVIGELRVEIISESSEVHTLEWKVSELMSEKYEIELQDESACEFLKKIYLKYKEILEFISGMKLDGETKKDLEFLIEDFRQMFMSCYQTNNCHWEHDINVTETIGADINKLLLKLAELSRIGKLGHSIGIELRKYSRIKDETKIDKLAEGFNSIDEINQRLDIIGIRSRAPGDGLEIKEGEKWSLINHIKRIEIVLKEKLLLPESNLEILNEYRFLAQNFDRKDLNKIVTDEAGHIEAELTMHLCKYLHNHGFMPIYNPRLGYAGFATSIPDLIDVKSLKYSIIIEIKVIKTEEKNRIITGFGQIYQYVNSLGEKMGYYIIFNGWEGRRIILPKEISFANGITIYCIVIDVTKTSPSSQILTDYSIIEEELRGFTSLEPPDHNEEEDQEGDII